MHLTVSYCARIDLNAPLYTSRPVMSPFPRSHTERTEMYLHKSKLALLLILFCSTACAVGSSEDSSSKATGINVHTKSVETKTVYLTQPCYDSITALRAIKDSYSIPSPCKEDGAIRTEVEGDEEIGLQSVPVSQSCYSDVSTGISNIIHLQNIPKSCTQTTSALPVGNKVCGDVSCVAKDEKSCANTQGKCCKWENGKCKRKH